MVLFFWLKTLEQANPFGEAKVSLIDANGALPLGAALTAPVTDGVLVDADFAQLLQQTHGQRDWLFELTVATTTGISRTARMRISLPQPAPPEEPSGHE
mgnify:CR=1 FL=1